MLGIAYLSHPQPLETELCDRRKVPGSLMKSVLAVYFQPRDNPQIPA
jgi:hypothetical protein